MFHSFMYLKDRSKVMNFLTTKYYDLIKEFKIKIETVKPIIR